MPADTYFSYVDALAERLTLPSYVKASAAAPEVETSQTLTVTDGTLNITQLASWNMLSALPGLLGKQMKGRWATTFKTALKPGYSTLVPAVAIVFFARVHWGSKRGFSARYR